MPVFNKLYNEAVRDKAAKTLSNKKEQPATSTPVKQEVTAENSNDLFKELYNTTVKKKVSNGVSPTSSAESSPTQSQSALPEENTNPQQQDKGNSFLTTDFNSLIIPQPKAADPVAALNKAQRNQFISEHGYILSPQKQKELATKIINRPIDLKEELIAFIQDGYADYNNSIKNEYLEIAKRNKGNKQIEDAVKKDIALLEAREGDIANIRKTVDEALASGNMAAIQKLKNDVFTKQNEKLLSKYDYTQGGQNLGATLLRNIGLWDAIGDEYDSQSALLKMAKQRADEIFTALSSSKYSYLNPQVAQDYNYSYKNQITPNQYSALAWMRENEPEKYKQFDIELLKADKPQSFGLKSYNKNTPDYKYMQYILDKKGQEINSAYATISKGKLAKDKEVLDKEYGQQVAQLNQQISNTTNLQQRNALQGQLQELVNSYNTNPINIALGNFDKVEQENNGLIEKKYPEQAQREREYKVKDILRGDGKSIWQEVGDRAKWLLRGTIGTIGDLTGMNELMHGASGDYIRNLREAEEKQAEMYQPNESAAQQALYKLNFNDEDYNALLAIKDSDLSKSEKVKKMTDYVKANEGRLTYEFNPNAGKQNWTAGAIGNQVADVATQVGYQAALMFATEGLGRLLTAGKTAAPVVQAAEATGIDAAAGSIGQNIVNGYSGAYKSLGNKLKTFGNTFGTTYAVTYHDAYVDGLQQGLSSEEAENYAHEIAAVNGLSETLSPDIEVVKKASKGVQSIPKLFNSKVLSKAEKFKSAASAFGKGYLANTIPETLEEIAAAYGEYGVDAIHNINQDDLNSLHNRVQQAITTTMIGMMPLGVASGVRTAARVPSLQKESLYRAGLMPQVMTSEINALVDNGSITQDEANKRIKIANTSNKIINSMPSESEGVVMSNVNKQNYVYNELQRAALQEKLDNATDPNTQKILKSQIGKLVEANDEIVKKATESVVAEEAGLQSDDKGKRGTLPVATENDKQQADIEKRRQAEIDELPLLPLNTDNDPELTKREQERERQLAEINAKYDAELAALNQQPENANNQLTAEENAVIEAIKATDKTGMMAEALKQEAGNPERQKEIIQILVDQSVDMPNLTTNFGEGVAKAVEALGRKSDYKTVDQLNEAADQALEDETEIPQEDEITVGEMLDKKGSYKGQRGTFIQEGQTIEFRTDDGKRIYELGNVEEIGASPITDFDIAQEETVIKVNEDGTIEARGKNYTVPDAENPLKAIQRDKEGNLTGVKLVDENGNDRTFRGQYAEDLAYQLTLQDINKDNESKNAFQTFLNEDAATAKELEDGGLSETTNEKANENTGSVSGVEEGERPQRAKITKNERKPAKKAGKSIPENKGTATQQSSETGVPQSTDATGRGRAETAATVHANNIKDKFRQQFKAKGISDEQIDGAIALMDARAKSWASEEKGRNADEWYQKIADVKSGEFETDDILYQSLPKKLKTTVLFGAIMGSVWNFNAKIPNKIFSHKADRQTVSILEELASSGFIYIKDGKIKYSDSANKNEESGFLKNLWAKAGFPKINILVGQGRPKYLPHLNEINIYVNNKNPNAVVINYDENGKVEYGITSNIILGEMAHALQAANGDVSVGRFIRDFIASKGDYEKEYFQEGSLEHEAHSVIQPELEKKFYQQLNSKVQKEQSGESKIETIKVQDTRTKDAATGKAVTDRNNLSSDNVDVTLAKELINEANKQGVDPYLVLAIAMQETGIGREKKAISKDNPLHLSYDIIKDEKNANKNKLELAINFLKEKLALGKRLGKKGDADVIQAWNGYGKIDKNSEDVTNSYYGIDVSKNPIDMNKNPVYGKRIVDIRDNIIKKSPELVKLVEDSKNTVQFQEDNTVKRGALETLKDGRVVIHALDAPDFSTMVHEIAHIFEKDLTDAEKKKVKDFGGSEAFARGFERYLRDGKAPNAELKSLFDKFKEWLTNIYQSLKGSPIEKRVTPEIKQIFDRLLTEKKIPSEEGTSNVESKSQRANAASERTKVGKNSDNTISLSKIQQDAADITTGKKVFERLSPEEERSRIESGRANVEATLLLSRLQEAGANAKESVEGLQQIKDSQEAALEQYAKDAGIWQENIGSELGAPHANGFEQDVYLNPNGTTVTKLNNGLTNDNWLELLDRIAVHNSIFPDTKYTLKGFGRNADGMFVAIVEQPLIKGNPAKFSEVKEELGEMGYRPINDDGETRAVDMVFKNEDNGTFVTDVHGENVIKGDDGRLYFIDPLVNADTAEQGYGGKRVLGNTLSQSSNISSELATSVFEKLGDKTKLKGTQKETLEEQFGKNIPDFAIFINKNFDKIVNQLIDSKNLTRKCQ